MTTINDALNIITPLWEKYKAKNIEQEILGLHEAATKLNIAVGKKNDKEINKRIASVFIGVLSTAKSLGIEDLDTVFQARITQLNQELA